MIIKIAIEALRTRTYFFIVRFTKEETESLVPREIDFMLLQYSKLYFLKNSLALASKVMPF